MAIVDDVAGTPITKKITVDNVDDYISASSKTLTNKSITSPTLTGTVTSDAKVKNATGFFGGDAILLNDDTAVSFTPQSQRGVILIYSRGVENSHAMFTYAAEAGPLAQAIITNGSSVTIGTSALSGTTGTDAKYNYAAASDGKIYIENRIGAARYFYYVLLGGL